MKTTIFGVGILPGLWPPSQQIEIVSRVVGKHILTLEIDAKGRFVATLKDEVGVNENAVFNPIILPAAGRYMFCLAFSDTGFQITINGHEVPRDIPGAEPIALPYQDRPELDIELIFPNLDPSIAGNSEEHLLLSTIRDIDTKALAGDRYSLIRASGLLRQVLLDGLLHVVNRNHRTKITFTTIDFKSRPPLEVQMEAHWQNLDPSLFPGARTIDCALDEFLAAPCLTLDNCAADVKDLVRACANAKGGVHLGKARVGEEQSVLDWDKAFKIAGEEPSLSSIRGICRIVLTGFKELVEEIKVASTP